MKKKVNKEDCICPECREKLTKEERRAEVYRLLLNAAYTTKEDFEYAVETLSRSNMSLEEIEEIGKALTPESINTARKIYYGPKIGGGVH